MSLFEADTPSGGCRRNSLWLAVILAGFVGMLAGLYQLAQALT